MPRAVEITAEHRFGRIGQLMKKCSHCKKNFVGTRVVERWFGRMKSADGHHYQCKRCIKLSRDIRRAPGKAYLAARKRLTECENPLCECTIVERAEREQRLEHHHLDPSTKIFNPAHGTDRPIGQLIDEVHKTICLCKWSHDQTKGYRGALSEYGLHVANEYCSSLAQFESSRHVGSGDQATHNFAATHSRWQKLNATMVT